MNTLRDAALVESEGAVQLQGRELVTAVYAAGRALDLYPSENTTVQNALEELQRVVDRLMAGEGGIDLRVAGEFLLLNGARLRLELSDYGAFSFLLRALRRNGIGAVRVDPGVDADEWVRFLGALGVEGTGANAFERFAERLGSPPLDHIDPTRESDDDLSLVDDRANEAAKRTYFQSVQVAREVLTDTRLGRAVNVRRVKRAVQGIVDQVLQNEMSIVGMTTLREFDEYTFTHSVNVCILSVVFGQKLGLSKTQLYELGLGALFHDIGKMRIDPAVVNKTGALTDAEWKEMKEHPVEGLLALSSMYGFEEVPYRTMLIAYEHHMREEAPGYPENRRPRRPTLFSQIVGVADGYDAATSKRSYQALPLSPEDVLREMRDNRRRGYDPLLVKALINVTGVYPVGTLAILDTYELAVVARSADPTELHRPVVKIITDPLGSRLAEPRVMDLSERDPSSGRPRRTIIKTTDPDKHGIRIADYFL